MTAPVEEPWHQDIPLVQKFFDDNAKAEGRAPDIDLETTALFLRLVNADVRDRLISEARVGYDQTLRESQERSSRYSDELEAEEKAMLATQPHLASPSASLQTP